MLYNQCRMAIRWTPLHGKFDISSDGTSLEFHGGSYVPPYSDSEQLEASEVTSPPETQPLVGVAVSDIPFREGAVSATVTFEAPEDEPDLFSAGFEIALGYDPKYQMQRLSVGFAGRSINLFSIREWSPPPRNVGSDSSRGIWNTIAHAGTKQNLKAGIPYRLEVRLSGSRVDLWCNGASVLSAYTESVDTQQKNLALVAISKAKIRIDDFDVDPERPRAFVVMHFGERYTPVYVDVIKSVCEDQEFGITPIRADEIYTPGALIIGDITRQIVEAQIVIADISEPNANVYFEVGYALAQNKPIILLARQGTELPFDVSGFRVLFYEDSIGGKSKFEEGLRKHLRAIRGGHEMK